MYDSVKSYFFKITEKLEGVKTVMYCDVKGLVTFGIGNLIDPLPVDITKLLWLNHRTGKFATQTEIQMEWQRVKDYGAKHDCKRISTEFWDSFATLSVPNSLVEIFAMDKLLIFEQQLRVQGDFANYDKVPADAQLALLLMMWAMGTGFAYPLFRKFFYAGSYVGAALQSHMDDSENPGLTPRNEAVKLMLLLAQLSSTLKMDPSTLLYGVIY